MQELLETKYNCYLWNKKGRFGHS